MKRANVLLLLIIILLVGISGAAKFYKYMVQRDYTITATVPCNPEQQNCFLYECEEGICEEDTYKYIEKKAYDFNKCNPYNEECPEEECLQESGCVELLCSEESLSEGERCFGNS
jgi:hypothetical protein